LGFVCLSLDHDGCSLFVYVGFCASALVYSCVRSVYVSVSHLQCCFCLVLCDAVQLDLEAFACSMSKVYSFGPCFRAERFVAPPPPAHGGTAPTTRQTYKSFAHTVPTDNCRSTGQHHLAEFWMVCSAVSCVCTLSRSLIHTSLCLSCNTLSLSLTLSLSPSLSLSLPLSSRAVRRLTTHSWNRR